MVVPNLSVIKIPENQEALRLKKTADREIGELDAMLNRLHKLDSDINRLLNESNDVERNVVSNLRGKSKMKPIKIRNRKSKKKVSRKVKRKVNVKRKKSSKRKR